MPLPVKNTFIVVALCLVAFAPVLEADVTVPTAHDDPSIAESEDDCWRIGPWHEGAAYVDLSFTVTKEGEVRDPVAVKTVLCGITREETEQNGTSEKLRSEFEKAAIKAVLAFKYKPRIIDGDAVEVPGVETRITFKQENEPDDAAEEPAG